MVFQLASINLLAYRVSKRILFFQLSAIKLIYLETPDQNV